jgi:hypothetical protein
VSNGISPDKISAATTANDQTSESSVTSLPLSNKISGALQLIFLERERERERKRDRERERQRETDRQRGVVGKSRRRDRRVLTWVA